MIKKISVISIIHSG